MPDSAENATVRTILVVDDDERVLRAYELSLRRSPSLRVFTASNAKDALVIAAQAPPDLAIVDVFLKGELGIELVLKLKANHPSIEIAVISAHVTPEIARLAGSAGARTILLKPAAIAQILRRLDGEPPPELDRMRPPTLAQAEQEHIERVVADCNGNITLAARYLGIDRSTIHRKLKP